MFPLNYSNLFSIFCSDSSANIEHLPSKGLVTIHQKSLFLIWIGVTVFWLCRKARNYFTQKIIAVTNNDVTDSGGTNQKAPATNKTAKPKPATFDDALSAVFIFGCVMIYFFMCDYVHIFPKTNRTYKRGLFVFLCIALTTVAIVFTSRETIGNTLLNRDQTEEWRGWMQVLFVLYHYFHAVEIYNVIRVFIAAYVWMTGFGNFAFFWTRKDYSLLRMLKVLFRLNFLAVMTTIAVDTSYMLYYICAMHTFWYLTVYTMMRPFQHFNENRNVMYLKFILYFIVITLLYEIPGMPELVYSPFSFVLMYKSPRHSITSLHEWLFRSRLDHYMTLVGMLCAYFRPNVEEMLEKINAHKLGKTITVSISVLLFFLSYYWYTKVFVLPKYEYNEIHPYTAVIPLLTFIYLRNCTSFLRNRYIYLFAFLGKITLETYIAQYHIYLKTNLTSTIVYMPGYPLINFIINTAIYLSLSRYLFKATCTLSEFIFHLDRTKMVANLFGIIGIVICSYLTNIGLGILLDLSRSQSVSALFSLEFFTGRSSINTEL